MEYVYAALLLHKLKQPVTEDNVKKVISAAGVSPDDIQVKALVSALGEINIDDALKNAAAAPVAAAAPAAGTAQAPTAAAPAGKPKEEESKEEEKKEEQALEGLSSLFG